MQPVQLSEIFLTFGRHHVLDGLNLSVESGEYVVILGPSGCGKTSLLRLIAGLIRPQSGSIRLDGNDVAKVPPRHRNVALVPQSGGLYPHLSIGKSISLGIHNRVSRAERMQRVREAARFVEIEPLLERRPQELSGGQLRRAALAKAVASGKRIRLFDEPLSAIEADLRFRIGRDLRRIHDHRPGVTLHVTHDGREALRLGDKIGVIDQGRIVQLDTPGRIQQSPATPLVAAAVGSSPLITIDLKRDGDDWVTPDGQTIKPPHSINRQTATVGFYQDDALTHQTRSDNPPPGHIDAGMGMTVALDKLKWFKHPAGQENEPVKSPAS